MKTQINPWELTVKNVLKEGFSHKLPCCDMTKDCPETIAYLDIKGYVYCSNHGQRRKAHMQCRKLTNAELKSLRFGRSLTYKKQEVIK